MTNKLILTIEGMSCNHCVSTVKEALSKADNVKKVKVRLRKKEAMVESDQELNAEPLIKAVEEAGYHASVKP